MKVLSKGINFLKEVRVQLTKVSWPTKKELMGATTVVIVITCLTAVFISIVDLVLSNILNLLFR